MAESSSTAPPCKSCDVPTTKPRSNSSRLCRGFLTLPGRRRNDDALFPPPPGTRLLSRSRRIHSRLPLHDACSRQLLRRDAPEPADRTGNTGRLAHSISARPSTAPALRLLAKFRAPRPDGLFVCLQQSGRAAPAGPRTEHSAADSHRNAACLGDCPPARSLERRTHRAFPRSRDFLEHSGPCSCSRFGVGSRPPRTRRKNALVSHRRHGLRKFRIFFFLQRASRSRAAHDAASRRARPLRSSAPCPPCPRRRRGSAPRSVSPGR